MKRHATLPAVTGAGVNFDFVNEHGGGNFALIGGVFENKKGEARSLALKLS
jgi:hypothetical protein